MARKSEFDIIRQYFAPLSEGAPGALGLTNDAALWRPSSGHDGVVTADCMVAEVHFFADDPADSVAEKILAVNLSDLASMGARPSAYTLAAAWPAEMDEDWIARFAGGLQRAQSAYGVDLIGGDTVATPGPLTLSLTAFGEVLENQSLSRSEARPGDNIYVTGTIGDAALGLKVLKGELEISSGRPEFLIDRYRRPQARTSVGMGLLGVATSAIDVSDGLAADLGHIAEQSDVDIQVQVADIPLSEAARSAVEADETLLEDILGGGDDYELAFTAPADRDAEITELASSSGVPITRIGRALALSGTEAKVGFFDGAAQQLAIETTGFRHF